MNPRFLESLDARLTAGFAPLAGALSRPVRAFVLARHTPEGGFRGRQGGADTYYTDFAVRLLVLLDENAEPNRHQGAPGVPPGGRSAAGETPAAPERDTQPSHLEGGAEPLRGVARYLAALPPAPADLVDCFSRLNALRLLRARGLVQSLDAAPFLAALARERLPGGGYAPVGERRQVSAYRTFLAGLCAEVLGVALPQPKPAARAVRSLRTADGGYAERPGEPAGQTNATAAAVAFLAMRGRLGANATSAVVAFLSMRARLDANAAAPAARFLARMQAPDGGFRAHQAAPCSDLLSTFTGLWALSALNGLPQLDLAKAAQFVRASRTPDGGFRGVASDPEADVEYTYYGLGALALLRAYVDTRREAWDLRPEA